MMYRLYCNSEAVRYSAYHLIKAFLPDEEIIQEKNAPCSGEEDFPQNKEFLIIWDPDRNEICKLSAKKLLKDVCDQAVYDLMKGITGKDLPWGVLTGVRPVKLAREMLSKEDTDISNKESILKFLSDKKRVSKEKAALCVDIAMRERRLIREVSGGTDRDYLSYSLYVGIPICPSICSYCSFSSGPLSVWGSRLGEYVDALISELSLMSTALKPMKLTSVYIGGGTPTVLSAGQLENLMNCIEKHFDTDSVKEYTLEAGRADTITEDKLKTAISHGVTRISVNPQSMQQKTLERVGRSHTADQVIEAFDLARGVGFKNINMDVIAGLPGEDEDDMADTLRQISDLGPDSLTVHALAVKRAARISTQSTDDQTVDKMIELGAAAAKDMGMKPYYLYRQKSIAGNHENIGYAREGCEGIYNVMIMEDVQSIAAFGAGAVSKALINGKVQNPDRAKGVMTNLLRQENVSSIADYIERVVEMSQNKEKVFENILATC